MIKQPLMLVISLVLLAGVGLYALERLYFLSQAERTIGEVVSISAKDGRCGGRRSKYNCTEYKADVRFFSNNSAHEFNIGAGNARGHGQSKSKASHKTGDEVKVVYDPENPKKAYEDSTMGVWGGPIMMLIAQIVTFFSSFTEDRRRRFF